MKDGVETLTINNTDNFTNESLFSSRANPFVTTLVQEEKNQLYVYINLVEEVPQIKVNYLQKPGTCSFNDFIETTYKITSD